MFTSKQVLLSYHCAVIHLLSKLVLDYMVHILSEQLFTFETNYICSNMGPLLDKNETVYVFVSYINGDLDDVK